MREQAEYRLTEEERAAARRIVERDSPAAAFAKLLLEIDPHSETASATESASRSSKARAN